MNWPWIIVFGAVGTGTLLYICLFVYMLNVDPNQIRKLEHAKWETGRHDLLEIIQVLGLFVLSFFVMYQVSFFLLGWIPSDWGNIDEYGEWATTQHSISLVFCTYLGVFVFQGVHKGIIARVEADELRIEHLLRDEIDSAYNIQSLKDLKDEFSVALADGFGNIERPYSGGYLRAIEESKLNQDIYDELFRKSITRIDKRFIHLRGMGIDTEG